MKEVKVDARIAYDHFYNRNYHIHHLVNSIGPNRALYFCPPQNQHALIWRKTNNIIKEDTTTMKKTTLVVLIMILVVALVLAIGNKILAEREHDKFIERRKECLISYGYEENPYTGWLTKDETRFWFTESEDGRRIESYPVHICVYRIDYADDEIEFVLCSEALDAQEGLSFEEFEKAMSDCINLGNKVTQVYVYAGGRDKPHNKWLGYDRLKIAMDLEG